MAPFCSSSSKNSVFLRICFLIRVAVLHDSSRASFHVFSQERSEWNGRVSTRVVHKLKESAFATTDQLTKII
jgi:hypothetical protein